MERSEEVARLLAGNESAWRRFLTDYGRLVYAVASRLGLSEAEKEDHFQAVSLAAYRALPSLRDADRLTSWLYNIAYRAAVDLLRKRRPETDLDTALATQAAAVILEPRILDELERLERVADVRDALARLDDRCRNLLHALFLEDPSPGYTEISRRQGIAMGSIGPTRARCLKKLQIHLEGLSNDPGHASTDREASAE